MPRVKKPEIFAVPWKSSRVRRCLLSVPVSSHNSLAVSILPVERASACRFWFSFNPCGKADRLKPVLLRRGFCLRRFARAIQNVGVDQANLRGRDVSRERRHAKFLPRPPQQISPELLVRGVGDISKAGPGPAADGFPAVAPRTSIRKE